MPNFIIEGLGQTTNPTLDSIFPCVQNGVTKQISLLQVKNFLDDGTFKQLSGSNTIACNPEPITSAGSVSFQAPGLMSLYAGATDPTGWLLCDGRSLVVAQYQELFNVLQYTYGGSGLNFNIPNLVGRSVAGLDNMNGQIANVFQAPESKILGASLGSRSVTLAPEQTPLNSHSHTSSGSFSVSPTGNRTGNNSSAYSGFPKSNFNTNSGQISVALGLVITISGQPANVSQTQEHENLPPFLLLNWIIKI